MLECIFTIDYEIYGNGEGSLRELVYEPALKLKSLFDQAGAKFVVFVEAAELEIIGYYRTDPAIYDVEGQIRDLFNQGHEIALHLHPQWYNGRHHDGKWELDDSEYNLCSLTPQRIVEIVDRSIGYLQRILDASDYKPVSFRAGNWLFQPTRETASALAAQGVKIDSSVFKGGVQHQHNLDYRRATGNGYYWKFQSDVNMVDSQGGMVEIPIFTQMVTIWKMATAKRIGLQQKSNSGRLEARRRVYRLLDRARFRYPLKMDFCRMTLKELTSVIDQIVAEDKTNPVDFKPIVAIGHTKDLVDLKTVENFLSYLKGKRIPISTFRDVYPKVA